jgi:hypothetical protein
MNRNQTIDSFRGLAILGMVFFTLTLSLSRNLPFILRHNVRGSVHLGDFVLPMFLFASGLSIAYFIEKRKNQKQKIFFKDVTKRFTRLAIIGIFLSFFSAYRFLEMDEVMLSAILFIACIFLYKFNLKTNLFLIFLINSSYFVLIYFDKISIFKMYYLGGYPAAVYYLPVMLTGLLIGKEIIENGLWSKNNKLIFVIIIVFFIFFSIFIPIDKLAATPSFMMFSILFSILIFIFVEEIIQKLPFKEEIEYLGKKPIRYWLMMFIIFIIPLWFYFQLANQTIPLDINWFIAIVLSFGAMIFLYLISIGIDYITISD